MAYEQDGGEEPANQRRLRRQVMDQLKRQQLEEQKKEAIKRVMEPAAYGRLMNVRAANPELYSQLVDLIISLVQQGRLQGRLTEKQLIDILQKVTSRPEPTIEFKHK